MKRRLLREINSLKGPIDALKYFGGVNLTGLGVCNNGNHPTMCTSTSLSYQQSFPTFLQFGIVFVSFFFCCMCHCYQVSTGFILSAISNPNHFTDVSIWLKYPFCLVFFHNFWGFCSSLTTNPSIVDYPHSTDIVVALPPILAL